MKNQNFGLTEDEYNKMLLDLKNGDEGMFEHIFLSHFSKSLIFLKHNLRISHELAYDACMETLLEFRRGLLNDKFRYGNLNYLFTRIATQKYFKSKTKEYSSDLSVFSEDLYEDPIVFSDEEKITLDVAWEQLGKNCQLLLKKFYYEKVKLKEMAESSGKQPATIRKQKERCVQVLRNALLKVTKTENINI